MDEDQYKNIYNELNPNRCIFEKAITNRRVNCQQKRKFVLASRECVACQSEPALLRCTAVLDAMRNNARFSLKVVTVNGPMPHNKELQVQAGGMLALQSLLQDDNFDHKNDDDHHAEPTLCEDVDANMRGALKKYGSIDQLPYGELVKHIVKYQSRPKRRKK